MILIQAHPPSRKLTVRNTTKGKLTGYFHFANVYIWNKTKDRIEQRLLVIRNLHINYLHPRV